MFEHAADFWSRHVLLANASHMALGFGLAVVLQRWRRGNSFVPVWVGWLLLAFGLATHAVAFTS